MTKWPIEKAWGLSAPQPEVPAEAQRPGIQDELP